MLSCGCWEKISKEELSLVALKQVKVVRIVCVVHVTVIDTCGYSIKSSQANVLFLSEMSFYGVSEVFEE